MSQTNVAVREERTGFYPYWILVIAFLCLFVSSGCHYYSFGLFVKPLQETFDWSRAEIMTASTLSTFAHAAGSLLAGKLLEYTSSKKIIVTGAVITTVLMTFTSRMTSLWQFYLFYGLSGFTVASIGFVPASRLVFEWFKTRRGMAIGIAGMGMGVGGFALPLLTGRLFIPAYGWRNTFVILGVIASVLIVPLTLFTVKDKTDNGFSSRENSSHGAHKPVGALEEGIPFKAALKTPTFWLIGLTGAAFSFCNSAIVQNQAAHLQDIGFPIAVAATAVSSVGIANAVGKPCFGWLCDAVKPKYSRAIGLCFQFVGVLVLLSLGARSPQFTVWLSAILIGLSVGSMLPSMSMLVSTNFGLLAYGTIFGMVSMFNHAGSAAGPLFAGYIYDIQGSYHSAFVTFAVLNVVAIVAALLISKPRARGGGS